ncbi:MAG TPA: hypothetical protein VJR92_14945 [Gemmatimonadaceae bacterium]|nr:hypothetical protein [Gemmatimonadaceae bacterium]
MPIAIRAAHPSMCIRRSAFERAGLTRASFDDQYSLTDDEFRVESELIVIGPLFGDNASQLLAQLERAGLEYFEDYFELSGNWPEWLAVYARHDG